MPGALPFLDTNILLRHLTHDHPEHSPRATAYLSRVEAGELRVRTADTVIFETVFTLQRYYKLSRAEIRDRVLPIILLPGIVLPGKPRLRATFDLYVQHNVSFIDAMHAVLMQRLGIQEIVSFDLDYDRVPGLKRIEP
ncbi:MAG: type II toxin-antitoxin system VapC family toxin [Armatimonadetes bacterium]|nr:type II toxin-antitoxin system VapC family toxin [Armatimonadota bacterium]